MSEYQSDKFLVLKWSDLHEHLTDQQFQGVTNAALAVEQGRTAALRNPRPAYFVCNQDEPYADRVLEVILQGEKDNE